MTVAIIRRAALPGHWICEHCNTDNMTRADITQVCGRCGRTAVDHLEETQPIDPAWGKLARIALAIKQPDKNIRRTIRNILNDAG